MDFLSALTPHDRENFLALRTPVEVQAFLDSMPYDGGERDRSPLNVIRERRCHCLDGGMFAALALGCIGFPPLLIDLVPEPGTDDDHVLAIFKVNGLYGAVAKSNFSGLRYREPIHRGLRELVMTYFEVFFNIDGMKTLRGYTRPFHLAAYDRYNWQTDEADTARVIDHFYNRGYIRVIPPELVSTLSRLDQRAYQTNMIGVDRDGLYKGPDQGH
jgi:hypothetical protein